MLEIIKISKTEAVLIHNLAKKVWKPTYGKILSEEQLEYMFEQMYSVASIENQIESLGQNYYIVYCEGESAGYFSFEKVNNSLFKLHKIYVIPSMQGNGIGYFLLQKAVLCAMDLTNKKNFTLQLNVNRHNSAAIKFYEKQGFVKTKEVDINIGNNYYMNDYVLELSV